MSASVVPRTRHVPADVAEWAAAPSEARSTSGMPARRDAQQPADQPGDGDDEQDPTGQVAEVDAQAEDVVHRRAGRSGRPRRTGPRR